MDALTPTRLSFSGQVSPIHTLSLHDHSVSNHLGTHRLRLYATPTESISALRRTEASPLLRRLAESTGRIEFLAYGLVIRLTLLSTPPHGDAVGLGYRSENDYLAWTFTLLTVCAFGRTGRAAPSAPLAAA